MHLLSPEQRRGARNVKGGDELLLGFARALRVGRCARDGGPRPRLPRRGRGGRDRRPDRGPTSRVARPCAATPTTSHSHDRVFEAWFTADLPRPTADRAVAMAPAAAVDLADADADGAGDGEGAEDVAGRRQRRGGAPAPGRGDTLGGGAGSGSRPCSRPFRSGPRSAGPPGTRPGTGGHRRCLPHAPHAACAGWGSRRRSDGRRRRTRPRRVVLLVDVSGSMSGYADAMLRVAHQVVARSGGARSRCSPSAPG